MITAREVVVSLYGALRLARFDAGGMAFFDTSRDGFWRSFYAALLVAPLYLAVLLVRFASGEVEADALRYLVVEASGYTIHWVAFPLIMFTACRAMEREERYVPFIVAYNWAAVIQNAVFLPVALFGFLDVFPENFSILVGGILFSAILVYDWFVARTALQVSALIAGLIVAFGLFLNLFVNIATETML